MKNKITVIGLGAGDIEQLQLGIYRKLKKTRETIYVRTEDHPVISSLKKEGVSFQSFDRYYEEETQFTTVYERIVETLLKTATEESIIYTVPGHPMLAEYTVQLLLEQDNIEIDIMGGQSYLDDLFTSLKIDPINGFQFLDGTSFERGDISYDSHLVFCQVYDRYIASDVKLVLLEDLPADYSVTIVEAVGTEKEVIKTMPLEELDRSIELSNLTSVYVPPVPKEMLNHTFSRLREVISILRGPSGCEWDRDQTHESLRRYLIEETFELIDAIDEQDDELMIEELGDVLFQVMLHSQIGMDSGYFTVDDVIKSITDKMIFRHPHVFNGNETDKQKSWEDLKQIEKKEQRASILEGVAHSLPALAKARKIQSVAAKVGFDWTDVEEVWQKLDEEIKEVKHAIKINDPDAIEDELGDVLFVISNLARHYNIDPELALSRTNKKFITRFTYIEKRLIDRAQDIYNSSLEEMNYYWDEAKRKEE